jgi:hypothetical protein
MVQAVDPTAPMNPTLPPDYVPASAQSSTPGFVPKKKNNLIKILLGSFMTALVLVGSGSAYWLSTKNQDVRQQASGETYGGTSCGTQGETKCDASGQRYVCQNYTYVAGTKFASYDECMGSDGKGLSCNYNGQTYSDGQCINDVTRCVNGQQAKSLDGSCGEVGDGECDISPSCGGWVPG